MVSIYIEAIESAFQISMFVYLCLPIRMRGTAHAGHSTCGEQLAGTGSLLLSCGPQELNSGLSGLVCQIPLPGKPSH